MTQEELLLQTEQQMNTALAIAKVYIDQGDAAGKAYTDQKLELVLQTTDLNAKLALLQQINEILDGDNATAGFQAWQQNVAKLTDVYNRLTTGETDIATLKTSMATVTSGLATLSETLGTRITNEVATLNATITAKDTATNARIDTIAAGIATDKIAQVEKDATQNAALAAEKARVDVLVTAVADEATARANADSAFNTRATNVEGRVSTLESLQGEYVTRAQYVAGISKMVAAATSVFGINPDGSAVGTSGAG